MEPKRVRLLVFSEVTRDAVCDAMGEASDIYGDNGGEPDGWWLFARPASDFWLNDIGAAVLAGAQVIDGYEVPYIFAKNLPSVLDLDIEFCGYQVDRIAYTPTLEEAIKLVQCIIWNALDEDDLSALFGESVDLTDTLQQLIDTYGPFQVWPETKSVTWPLAIAVREPGR